MLRQCYAAFDVICCICGSENHGDMPSDTVLSLILS